METHMNISPNTYLSKFGMRISDYATMAKGAWSIQRNMPNTPAYTEFWNDEAGEWCSACTVYSSEMEAFGRAIILALSQPDKQDDKPAR